MKPVSIYYPHKIDFGAGSLDQFFSDYLASGKKKIYIITIEQVVNKLVYQIDNLITNGVSVLINTSVKSEPTFSDVENILEEVKEFIPDTVAGIGGGSVMDVAKIAGSYGTIDHPLIEYVGNDLIPERKVSLVCAPTTSGTGSEVSPNAILIDTADNQKKGFISKSLIPDYVYVDPVLTLGLSPFITAYTGIDALTHCIEAYVNCYANPFTDTLALQGISLISKYLPVAIRDINNIEARSNLSLGSLYGGMCLGPVNTAAVHALAYPLAGEYKLQHGLSNALLLPFVMEYNLDFAEKRYADIARAMGITGDHQDRITALIGIEFIKDLIARTGLPSSLKKAGTDENSIERMAYSALEVKRLLKNNVKELTVNTIMEIYQKVL